MFSLAEAVHQLRTRGSRQAAKKLFETYISGRERVYLLWSDYEALAAMPLPSDRLTFRFAQPDDIAAFADAFPTAGPPIFQRWLGPGYFLYLALAGEELVAYRCDSTVVPPSVRPILPLRSDQVFMVNISTARAFRRQGFTRLIRIAMARAMLQLGYRNSWGVQVPINRVALAAFDRTPDLVQRFGTLTRTIVLGQARFSLTPSRWLSGEDVGTLVQLVTEILPGASRAALLFNPGTTIAPPAAAEAVTRAAAKQGIELRVIAVTDTQDQVGAFAEEFAEIARQRADAVIVLDDPMYRDHRQTIGALARKHRLPTLYERPEFVTAGGLMARSLPSPPPAPVFPGLDVRALRLDPLGGARPGLFINLKTARSLGLAIPSSILLRADQVIE